MNQKYKDRFTHLTAVIPPTFAAEIQSMADALGVRRHKLLVESIKLGVPLARYKIALDRVQSEKRMTA